MRSLLSGLVDYWPLHEPSGTRYSALGRYNLTDNGTVTQNAGRQVYAGQFTAASSEYLSLADQAEFSGDVDYTFWAWVYLDSVASTISILSKRTNTGNQREYELRYQTGTGFSWLVSGDGISITTVNDTSGGVASTATWYLVRSWHDSVGNVIGIQSNLNTPVTTAHSAGSFAGTSGFMIGATLADAPVFFWDGRICEVGFTKRLLTDAEWFWLYNTGLGRTYPFDGRMSPAMLGRHPALAGPRRTRMVGLLAA